MSEIKGLGIHIKARDLDASRNFYETLGFKPVFGYGDDEFRASLPKECPSAHEKYNGITYAVGDSAKLEVAAGHIAVKGEVFNEVVSSAKISAMVEVGSLVPLIKEIKSELHFPVRSYYWGTIELVIKDPDGFVLVFTTKHSEKELEAVKELVTVEIIESS